MLPGGTWPAHLDSSKFNLELPFKTKVITSIDTGDLMQLRTEPGGLTHARHTQLTLWAISLLLSKTNFFAKKKLFQCALLAILTSASLFI